MPEAFVKKFQNFSFHNELFRKGDKIIIALSGGPDSTALALIFSKLAKKDKLDLLAIHINYGLRGKDSDRDEKFIRKLAGKLDIGLKVLKYKREGKEKGNLEEALRQFRYKIFEAERQKNNFNLIATAHTLDDQIETFFINLLRGTGSAGLSSLKAKRNEIVRPLLFASKKEILDFLKKTSVKSRTDRSNLDLSLTRNRIRLKLIPYLEKNYNPSIKQTISKTISLLTEQNELLEKITKTEYEKISSKGKNTVIFFKKDLEEMDVFLLKKIFRQAIVELSGNLRNIKSSHFFEFRKALTSTKPKFKTVQFKKILVEIRDKKVFLKKVKN